MDNIYSSKVKNIIDKIELNNNNYTLNNINMYYNGIIDIIDDINSLIKQLLNDDSNDSISIKTRLFDFNINGVLNEILNNIENKDIVSVNDLFQYELKSILQYSVK
ncbi:hypothetical protein [Thermoanaerobacterium thermosulfurigenes]|uniref:hypothetical protein n=1 Tax=Thermoanaerobacterium thermosulfurigenes TaxID=33950 RepID=UPI003EF9585A